MKKITVYFELFGKKMKTEVFAENNTQAMNVVKNKIIFHKFEEEKIKNPIEDFLKGF